MNKKQRDEKIFGYSFGANIEPEVTFCKLFSYSSGTFPGPISIRQGRTISCPVLSFLKEDISGPPRRVSGDSITEDLVEFDAGRHRVEVQTPIADCLAPHRNRKRPEQRPTLIHHLAIKHN
jgi:hypothetical protein